MNKYLVEFLGTLFLMYIILAVRNPLAIGSALAIAIILGGHVSGGHFNPAVSVALTSMGKLNKNDLLPYILSQIAGSMVAVEISKRFKP
jgi:aquaporin Z|tara:strand:- start:240 stop:506 length:267 start_codon:yes stop_codon:yes gene_type:complete